MKYSCRKLSCRRGAGRCTVACGAILCFGGNWKQSFCLYVHSLTQPRAIFTERSISLSGELQVTTTKPYAGNQTLMYIHIHASYIIVYTRKRQNKALSFAQIRETIKTRWKSLCSIAHKQNTSNREKTTKQQNNMS